MGLPHMSLRVVSSFILLLCINSPLESATHLGNETDRLALLAFKSLITSGPVRALSSWNNSLYFCNWQGVTCSSRHQRITALNLRSKSLVGSISPHIANLTFLRAIDLFNNSFHGTIPQDIGRLFRLKVLLLHENSLQGEIPSNLTRLSDLRIFDLVYNELVGRIPTDLDSFTKLVGLGLSVNNLTGRISPSLGNLSSLTHLSLARNGIEGSIPHELGRIAGLQFLQLSGNKLSGTIPPSLYNLSSIYLFSVADNQLHGSLPPDLGLSLPNLRMLYTGANRFTGHIPISITNASGLTELYFTDNDFTGPAPTDLGNLKDLVRLGLGGNRLESDDLSLLTSLNNCSGLIVLGIGANLMKGRLPSSIANLSTQLEILSIAVNQISGTISPGIENLVSLTALDMNRCLLTGTIPPTIGKLRKLQYLDLSRNGFTGRIPPSLGNITQMLKLYLEVNHLSGSIPSSLGNYQSLQILHLYQNKLDSSIPKEVVSLSSLSISFNLAGNSLTGPLPVEVGSMKNLPELDISENRLSGEIPVSLGECVSLERLYMQGNFFQGGVPSTFNNLKGIGELDLSRNNLSGRIPSYLEKLNGLEYLNLSFNNLDGEVPSGGIFRNGSAISVLGNSKLCGGISTLQLPACPITTSKKKRRSHVIRIVIPVISVVSFIILAFCLFAALHFIRKQRKKPESEKSSDDQFLMVSYAELLKATDGFSSANLIGTGSYGSVFKGILDRDEKVVAVKVLNLQQRGASKSFIAESEALRNIRHRNLVKILTSCSSIDFKGNDFKALVFEFMPNGSLEEWLHPKADGPHQLKNLSFVQRLNIAIDVASALDYLHQGSQQPIAHCDLKPSNVLLDEDMNAHVGDFGLARFLTKTSNGSSQNQSNTVVIKGSIGYVAPEYGMGGDASSHGDVYSYGILLLEMFTGKRPTDDMFSNGLSLHIFAKMALPEQVMEIVDPKLLSEKGNEEEHILNVGNGREKGNEEEHILNVENDRDVRSKMHDCLVSVVRIGVACSAESLRERMEMGDVVMEMNDIRDLFLGNGVYKERK
ncbi:probable LRR receptor-like serine/threonine-protein kinase At3g47570 [Magnolia sinica]|uniref:probable LRR receptor-like serine/threonine-protein kinase At3g47570 n=1 Tax=Magnolia sinica TaxID=86752 RepID=UPI00265844CF|nr:probable LRR receptor-like serine/threonine-protein kinase At3g47570 [Magnolia sinica]